MSETVGRKGKLTLCKKYKDVDEIMPKRPNQERGQELFCDW